MKGCAACVASTSTIIHTQTQRNETPILFCKRRMDQDRGSLRFLEVILLGGLAHHGINDQEVE